MERKQILLLVLLTMLFLNSFAAKVYNVRKYWAKGNENNIDTKAIQSAIDLCSAKGGGKVVFPSGIYLSSTIILKNGMSSN